MYIWLCVAAHSKAKRGLFIVCLVGYIRRYTDRDKILYRYADRAFSALPAYIYKCMYIYTNRQTPWSLSKSPV
jgi:hypothetical protein